MEGELTGLANRAWLDVDLDRLGHNFEVVSRRVTSGCGVMAVVKADAYAHGAEVLGPALEGFGARRFGVATAREGAALRRSGVEGSILVLAYTGPEQVELLLENDLTQTLADLPHAGALNAAAGRAGRALKAQVKLDTGMTRTGLACATPGELDAAAAVYRLPHLRVEGTFSHFSSADDGKPGAEAYCAVQLGRYRAALDGLTARGAAVGLRHMCNTGGTLKYPEAHFDLVRCGAALLGYNTAAGVEPWPLLPVGSLKAAVACLRDIPAGTAVSYGRTFVSERPMRVATLCLGYADGLPRALSNRGRVLLGGAWAPILGNICMDQMMVDATGCGEVAQGDAAVVIGRQGGLVQTADDLAVDAGTCAHEILSRLGGRLQRRYHRGGRCVRVVN